MSVINFLINTLVKLKIRRDMRKCFKNSRRSVLGTDIYNYDDEGKLTHTTLEDVIKNENKIKAERYSQLIEWCKKTYSIK